MLRISAVGVVASLLLGACGDDAGGCTEIREQEDPASFQHVVGATNFQYLSDPPTSGPHVGGAAPTGVLTNPLDPAVQVRILEEALALVQYDPAETGESEVRGFVETGAVVAPANDLPAPVVVTAWTWKLMCETVDDPPITEFIRRRPADAPGAG